MPQVLHCLSTQPSAEIGMMLLSVFGQVTGPWPPVPGVVPAPPVPGLGLVPAPPVPGLVPVPVPPVVPEKAPPWPLGLGVEVLPPAPGLPWPLPPVPLCEGAGVAVELEQPTSTAKTAKEEMRPTELEAN